MAETTDIYLDGKALIGDDYDAAQLQQWWDEEAEAYAGLFYAEDRESQYDYHGLNRWMYYDRFQVPEGAKAMALGGALGHELLPIRDRLSEVVIVDPSDNFARNHVLGDRQVSYVKSRVDGLLPHADNSFDVITCFGVLHHIANVSTVMAECQRVLKPGGIMFCREPIVAQGDWRKPRPGLTKNERGIPLAIFRDIARTSGFTIEKDQLFDFSPFLRGMANFGVTVFQHRSLSMIDGVLCRLFAFNTRYYRPGFLDKFGPASLAMALRKPG